MSDVPPASTTPPDLPEADLAEAGVYPSASGAADHGLVVLAAGYSYWLAESPDGFRLLVEPSALNIARAQLAAYDRESAHWPPPRIADPWTPGNVDFASPLLWALTILALHRATLQAPWLVERGALDVRAIWAGNEWWRPFTALFLHADAAHVLSNALGGLLVFSAVISTLGRMRGWLLVAGAGVLANLVIAFANRAQPYTSLGASTAVFASVGLLAGRGIRIAWRSTHPHRWRAMFAPFAAGATVLALYGAGEQRVDVGAHLTGFLVGVVLGFFLGLEKRAPAIESR